MNKAFDSAPVAYRMDQLVLRQPCKHCGVGPGMKCKTSSGRLASGFHQPRLNDLWEAYRLGFGRAQNLADHTTLDAPTLVALENITGKAKP